MTMTRDEVLAMLDELQDKIWATIGTPVDDHIQETVEMIRSDVQRGYDLEYDAGMIEKKPTVTAKWNQETQMVDVLVSWPIDYLELRFDYSDNPKNSAIDSPSEKP